MKLIKELIRVACVFIGLGLIKDIHLLAWFSGILLTPKMLDPIMYEFTLMIFL